MGGPGNYSAKPKYNMAKLKELRDCAPFVKAVVKTYKHQLAREQWKKLNMLVEILESDMTPSQFFTRFPDNKVKTIETVIGKLKAKFKQLWDPDVIVINDVEQPGTSASAAKANSIKKTAKELSTPNASKANAAKATAKKAQRKSEEKISEKPINKTIDKVADKTGEKKTEKQTQKTVENVKLDAKKSAPKTLPSAEQPKELHNEIPAAPTTSKDADDEDKTTDTIPLNLPTILRSTTATVDMTSPSPPPASIGTRRLRNGASPLSSPSTATDSEVFSRRPKAATNKPVDFEPRCNPSPPPRTPSPSSVAADVLADDVRLKSPLLLEARKKLAALSGTTNVEPANNLITSPLASNCNDPRGRNSSYVSTTLTPPKLAAGPTVVVSPSPVPPPANWPPEQHELNIPSTAPISNNNNNHNVNLNLNTVRAAPVVLPELLTIPEPMTFEHNGFSKSNNNLDLSPNQMSRRFNNLPNGFDLRDSRCVSRTSNGLTNGTAAAATQPQTAYGQGQAQAGRRGGGAGAGGPPYSRDYVEVPPPSPHVPSWQTSNNNYSYNINNNKNANNQMMWNNSNNGSNANHFNKNNANFNYRPAYNHAPNNTNTKNQIGSFSKAPPVGKKEPRTYGEYLNYKKEKLRQQEAEEKKRKLEAEKQRILEAAEKQHQLDDVAVTNIETDKVQLDTSYRNSVLPGNSKKIDFKIPKKATAEKIVNAEKSCDNKEPQVANTTAEAGDTKESIVQKADKEKDKSDDVIVGEEQSSSNKKSSKEFKMGKVVVKVGKVKKVENLVKANQVDKQQTDNTDKQDKPKPDKKTNRDVSQQKIKKSKSEKNNDKNKKSETTVVDKLDMCVVKKDKISADTAKGMDDKDNVENEPPTLVDNSATLTQPADKLSEVETDDSQQTSLKVKRKKSKNKKAKEVKTDNEKGQEQEKSINKEVEKTNDEVEKCKEETVAEKMQTTLEDVKEKQLERTSEEQKEELKLKKQETDDNDEKNLKNLCDEKPKELPKLPKIKVVLGPNAHTMVVIPADVISSTEDTVKAETNSKPNVELKRITQRRKSMMPVRSAPLVDTIELFGSSLDYEDVVDHQREQEKDNTKQRTNRSLAVMFEKSDDKCSVSTHNILAGKRRSRLNELTMNETELYRKVLNNAAGIADAVQKTETKPKKSLAVATETEEGAETVKRKRGRPAKEAVEKQSPTKRPRTQSQDNVNNELSAKKDDTSNTSTGSLVLPAADTPDEATSGVNLAPSKPRKAKRSELAKLNEDIAQMYYANDVLNATGRRACTARQQQSTERDSSRSSSAHSRSRSRSSSSSCSFSNYNAELAPYIRNVARRGRPNWNASGRASFKIKPIKLPTKRCRVRVARCAPLQRMLDEKDDMDSCIDAELTSCLVKNINPGWHSMSSALTNCVICAKAIKAPMNHYIQKHGEHYAARLPPGALQDLRAGISNRPIYRLTMASFGYTCPFCTKHLEMKNGSWVDHFARHTGEFNFQCSNCKIPRSKISDADKHVAKCGDNAKVLDTQTYDRRMPVRIHVCHLCDFVQLSRSNLELHMQRHHGIHQRSLTQLGQELLIFRIDNVPFVPSKTAAQKLMRRHKLSWKGKGTQADNNKKEKQKKLPKNTKKEPAEIVEEMAQTETVQDAEMVDVAADHEEILSVGGSIGMPPTLPEEEELLVINECKLELVDEDDRLAGHSQLPVVETTSVAQMEVEEVPEPETDSQAIPKLEISLAVETTQGQQEKEQTELETAPMEIEIVPAEQETAPAELEVAQAEVETAPITREEENIETATQQAEEPEEEPEEESEEELDSTEAKTKPKSKSIFRNFQKFCIKLKPSASPTSTVSSSSKGSSKQPNKSPATSNSDGEQPYLDAILAPIKKVPVASQPAKVPQTTTTTSSTLFLVSIQNVAYRLRSKVMVKPAYYCRYPGCSFLFSNELEGLENHFKSDHPTARWNGSCVECNSPANELPTELSINDELRHLVSKHMDASIAPALAPLPVATPAEPPMPKLRVRRFTGDRLAEIETPAQVVEETPMTTQPITVLNENVTLKDLLVATPRPPGQQHLDAAGVGEFLCAKTAPPTVTVLEPAPSSAVISQNSALGLAINQVYSLADATSPLITAETVPLPAVRNDDFVLTQSVTQNFDGQTPTEINISIEPRPESPVNAPAAAPEPNRMNQRINLIADRFRCMAANCNYCAHTVMCIKEHMKFHSFSFGNRDYLRCAYCSHVGKDIDDFVQHGVVVHGLANRSELQEPTESLSSSITQRIREVLNQRLVANAAAATTATVSSKTWKPSAQEPTVAPQAEIEAPISVVFSELLKETGFDDSKLYACPIRGCSVSLIEEAFINHVRYHQSSNPNMGPLLCKFCLQTFEKPFVLRSHLQLMHGRHKYFCSICLETTVNPRMMLEHMHCQHKEEFKLVNCQQQFLELTSYHNVPQMPQCWVSAMEQPFGQKQMDDFLGRLIEELRLRRSGSKLKYRISEMRLLAGLTTFQSTRECAKCQFKTRLPKKLHQHLFTHKLEMVKLAYPTEDLSFNLQHLQMAATELVGYMENTSTQAKSGLTSETAAAAAANEPALTLPAKVLVPGKQTVMTPKFHYVPKELRYVCGVGECGLHLPTEQALRKHFTTSHSYTERFQCVHCFYTECSVLVGRILEHLSNHKRHVYQCGGCPMFLTKRSGIDRHIHEKHLGQDIDVIIHRRTVDSIYNKNLAARWFKSVGPKRTTGNEWICNFCFMMLSNQNQMLAHLEYAHQRSYQYCCPYCDFGGEEGIQLVQHIRKHHPGCRMQPLLTYMRILIRNRQTLGFFCNSCQEVGMNFQKISKHCETVHQNRFEYKCSHCPFGNALERNIASHMVQEHLNLPGMAIQQFERLSTEMLDSDFWDIAKPLEAKASTTQVNDEASNSNCSSAITSNTTSATSSAASDASNLEAIDLISSDEEVEAEATDVVSAQKLYEFACSHCTETSNDVAELETKHWALKHPNKPFYFCVQPQMCCPECHAYKGNARSLLEEHLPNEHQIRTLMACDSEKVRECAYCVYKYKDLNDLAQHTVREAHLANDLKNITDAELFSLLRLGSTTHEYYQCDMCRVIMPTKVAIAQHGNVEHQNAPFCFRFVRDKIIYHCSFCMYASSVESETLQHMLDHYKKFCQCHFCDRVLNDGFEEYIQHCYTCHREEVKRFQQIHPYEDLKKFLMQILYQFQNGLIISKSSLRKTRFGYEREMMLLYGHLMQKFQKPPIPRILISQLLNRNTGEVANSSTTSQPPPATRITVRRNTLNTPGLQVPAAANPKAVAGAEGEAPVARPTNMSWQTSFTGSAAPAAPIPIPVLLHCPLPPGVVAPAPVPLRKLAPAPAPAPTAQPVAAATHRTAAAPAPAPTPAITIRNLYPSANPATHNQLPILQRIRKRRSTYVEPGQVTLNFNLDADSKRRCVP